MKIKVKENLVEKEIRLKYSLLIDIMRNKNDCNHESFTEHSVYHLTPFP